MLKSKLILQIVLACLIATLATTLIVSAATTIGSNISTDGNLTVSGTIATSTFSTGGLTVGTNQLVVQQTSGNVGIGTTAPGYTLDVNGNVNISGNLSGNIYATSTDYGFYNIVAWGDSLMTGLTPVAKAIMTSYTWYGEGVGGESSTQTATRLLATPSRWNSPTLIWSGRNNHNSVATVEADIASMIAVLPSASSYLVLGVTNGSGENIGGADYTNITTINNYLASLYGSHFIDIRAWIMTTCNPVGPTNTTGYYANQTQDIIDCGNGVPPTSLRTDTQHYNTTGYTIIANKVKSYFDGVNAARITKPLSYLDIPSLFKNVPVMGQATFSNSADQNYIHLGSELTGSSGWSSNGSWTGSYGAGFTHTAGTATALTDTWTVSSGSLYYISYTISGWTTGTVQVMLGGVLGKSNNENGNEYDGIRTISTGNLTFTPSSSFNGTISNISVKSVLQATSPTISILDGAGASSLEIRNGDQGSSNVFIGYLAGQYDFGSAPGLMNNAYQQNTAIGSFAFTANMTGYWNVAVGNMSLQNSMSSSNTAIGRGALYYQTTGGHNTAVGTNSLYNNTTGLDNAAIGVGALVANTTGSTNVAIGNNALAANTTGGLNAGNVAIGYNALSSNTTNSHNTAVGYIALQSSTGSANSAVGSYASNGNTSGSSNTAFGQTALQTNTTGSYNVVVGAEALRWITSSGNTAIGFQAGAATASTSNYSSLTDTYMTFLGYRASRDISIPNAATLTNGTAIGYNATVGASNSLVLGGTGTYAVNVGIGTTSPYSILSISNSAATAANTPLFTIASTTAGMATSTLLTVLASGNVGIGTSTPAATLDIEGYMRLKKNISQPVACGANNAGAIALNSSYIGCSCNGTSWINIASSTQACVW